MKNKTYFTSDTHFGHTNIIKYCERPFADAHAMDEAIIERWNARVTDDDIVYHLGDFTLAGVDVARRALSRLRGHIRVLGYPWHHDKDWVGKDFGPSRYRSASGHAVEILPPLLTVDIDVGAERKHVTLCHFPLGEWDRQFRGAWHLHGHSHGRHRGRGALLDVGVDCFDFTPASVEEIADLIPPQRERAVANV